MSFRRITAPVALLRDGELTGAMVSIGMKFAGERAGDANIEDTLLAASVEGMDGDDLRVLSVLVTWIDVHHAWINADRLTRLVGTAPSERVRAFWAAIGAWQCKDRRFSKLQRVHAGRPVDLLRTGTDFHMARKGEDPRFEETALRVPAGVLRDRKSDVLSPVKLARMHRVYRHRILMGPTYRADMWAALTEDPSIPASELARRTYGSFATAWQVRREFCLLREAVDEMEDTILARRKSRKGSVL